MIGIVGAGAIASAHAAGYRAAGAPVVAVMSRSLPSARRLAAECDAAFATNDLHDLLARPDVLAVDVCTPTDSHAQITIAAALAGKHVHVEKPMALSIADARRMVAACHSAGVRLMVGQTARYQASSRALRAAIDSDEIGRPQHVEIRWDHGTFWPGGWRGWQIDPAISGGHLVHNGVHAFDLACWLLDDRPVRVYAQGRAVAHPAMESHDYWHAQVLFESGASALCEIGYILRQPGAARRTLTVYGDAGTAWHDNLDDGEIIGSASPLLAGPDAIASQLRGWVCSLREGSPVPVTGEDGLRALAVALAARDSIASGQPAEVAE